MKDEKDNDLQDRLAQALQQMKEDHGEDFDISNVNLGELHRRTGISRGKLRKLKRDGFKVKPHGIKGRKATNTILSGFTGTLDLMLANGITNSTVCFERLSKIGYKGGQTTIKDYIRSHQFLVPASREVVAPQGSRGMRFTTGPAENYEMDWGFVNVDTGDGYTFKAACFAMICHHCGERYIEFFPNAKQESLFIGMIHGFAYMGVPRNILTDNMKSVVIGRDEDGLPIWQKDYEEFMNTIGFHTKLCKPRHPFTKGAVERLVRYVKENFLAGRFFDNISELNMDALQWCNEKNRSFHKSSNSIPEEVHFSECMKIAGKLPPTKEVFAYLCPERRISFDGFVNFEGRRFGVPYSYTPKVCRIRREGSTITIYSDDLNKKLVEYDVTWSRSDRTCRDQYLTEQAEEQLTAPVHTLIHQRQPLITSDRFSKFRFGGSDND